MCGIVGAVSTKNVVPVLLEGLKRLEYRGYDSCGVAFIQYNTLLRSRSIERVAELESQIERDGSESTIGIAHTRWATHGVPAIHNAHPHFSNGSFAVVHNGIIENHEELRAELKGQGFVFTSQTDTEVIGHLINAAYDGNIARTVRRILPRLHGAYAIAVVCSKEPGLMIGARHGSPLVLGIGDGENFLASDALALAGTTDQIVYLEEGDVVNVRTDGYGISNNGAEVERQQKTVHISAAAAELGPFRHFMQKEIFEQPLAISNTLEGVDGIHPGLFGKDAREVFADVERVLILACGTSYYAGSVAKFWIESISGLPCNIEVASEYRYRKSVPDPKTLVVTISQSGETADTLAALKHAQSMGMDKTLTICNVATSAMVRECKLNYITRAGAEIGVASTKAFTTQLVGLFLLTLTLAKINDRMSVDQEIEHLSELRHLPVAVQSVLALEPQIIAWAEGLSLKENALFLGRGPHHPIALEGALKLKEVSYIHAEAYSAGELKHGPLALVTSAMPVIVVAPNDELIDKLKSNLQEVSARGGQLFVFADDGTHVSSGDGIHMIRMPEHYGELSPILHVIALQLLAYHTACLRGTDVDKPRNLAKSVTVE
jgi:glucosamine--fructose-6-phosphate aminotransferase (isomerizing)